jgi:SAM-dependent methyltransferase
MTKSRFASYWHQIDEVLATAPRSVLEVGKGAGVFISTLKQQNVRAYSLDFDSRLNPDVVASVLDLPFHDGAFDVVASFQTLEHIPYESLPKALSEIRRVSRRFVVLSLPDKSRAYRISLQLPIFGELKLLYPMPRFKPYPQVFDGQHYWEIGKDGFPLKRVMADLIAAGLTPIKTFRVFENPYHRFFVLRVSPAADGRDGTGGGA